MKKSCSWHATGTLPFSTVLSGQDVIHEKTFHGCIKKFLVNFLVKLSESFQILIISIGFNRLVHFSITSSKVTSIGWACMYRTDVYLLSATQFGGVILVGKTGTTRTGAGTSSLMSQMLRMYFI